MGACGEKDEFAQSLCNYLSVAWVQRCTNGLFFFDVVITSLFMSPVLFPLIACYTMLHQFMHNAKMVSVLMATILLSLISMVKKKHFMLGRTCIRSSNFQSMKSSNIPMWEQISGGTVRC